MNIHIICSLLISQSIISLITRQMFISTIYLIILQVIGWTQPT